MYLKELIEKYGKEAKYCHEGFFAKLGFVEDENSHKDKTKIATWFYPEGDPIKDCDNYNGYKRVIFNELFLDDKWEVAK